jgi:hypothetical protein
MRNAVTLAGLTLLRGLAAAVSQVTVAADPVADLAGVLGGVIQGGADAGQTPGSGR